jgi:hypothetical protein
VCETWRETADKQEETEGSTGYFGIVRFPGKESPTCHGSVARAAVSWEAPRRPVCIRSKCTVVPQACNRCPRHVSSATRFCQQHGAGEGM